METATQHVERTSKPLNSVYVSSFFINNGLINLKIAWYVFTFILTTVYQINIIWSKINVFISFLLYSNNGFIGYAGILEVLIFIFILLKKEEEEDKTIMDIWTKSVVVYKFWLDLFSYSKCGGKNNTSHGGFHSYLND